MQQQFYCITAGQRSGTTALRSLLAGTDRFADLGEIFDTALIGEPQSFFGYCRKNKVELADILSGPDAEKVSQGFLAQLRTLAGDKHVLLDVKFNSWGELRMPWTYMHQEPFFLKQLKWMRTKFLFIRRRDVVAQVVSDRLSDKVGKWHNLEAQDVEGKIALDVGKLKERTRLLCLSEAYFYRNLKAYPATLMLDYEDLYDRDGLLTKAVRERLSQFCGEALSFPDTGLYFKNRIAKEKVVENYAEIAAALRTVVDESRDPLLRADGPI